VQVTAETAVAQNEVSRQDTTHLKVAHLHQQSLVGEPPAGTRRWVHRNLSIRIAESRRDRNLVADIIRTRHYLRTWPAKPRTLLLSYVADLGGQGAAAMAMVALLPGNFGALLPALDLHQAEVLQLVRSWRADDLGPTTAPDLMPETLRRVVKRVASDWSDLKCANLKARPKLLVTFADPAVGHDGALYLGAGATPLGPGPSGKLAFAWALDPGLKVPLKMYAQARAERRQDVG
jgi:hypothetical protein